MMLQAVPFQCSISVRVLDPSKSYCPTAHTSLVDTTATPFSSLALDPELPLGTCSNWREQCVAVGLGVSVGVDVTTVGVLVDVVVPVAVGVLVGGVPVTVRVGE